VIATRFLFALTTVALFTGAMKHGIEVEFKIGNPEVVAICTYTGNGPAAGAECVLFKPGSEDEEFQRGHTDANGVFSFIPDVAGEWKMIVDDGQGHRKETSLVLTEAFFASESAIPGSGELLRSGSGGFAALPLWMKAVWGLSLIFGLAGVFYLVKASRSVGKRNYRE